MQETDSREIILGNIRTALKEHPCQPLQKPDAESALFHFPDDDPLIIFAQELKKVSGKFVFCENRAELLLSLKQLFKFSGWDSIFCVDKTIHPFLEEAQIPYAAGEDDFIHMAAAATRCESLIARTGSILVSTGQISGRRLNVFPPVHIVLAKTSQVVPCLSDAINMLRDKYKDQLPSMISLITGPSRTADIEKTLILGAHGPKELYVFLYDEN